MDHIYFYSNASKDQLSEKTKTLHDLDVAVSVLEDMSIPDEFQTDLWKEYFKKLCENIRKQWKGIKNLSACFGINQKNKMACIVVGLSSEVYSLSLYVLDHFVHRIKKFVSANQLHTNDLSCSEDETDSEDVSSDLVQIQASPEEVNQWIQSFINGKRNAINIQNIKDFCVPPESSQNCARVDAVFVKRKNISHIGVEHVSNYWGPQLLKKMAVGSRIPLTAPQHCGSTDVKIEKRSFPQDEEKTPTPTKKRVLSAADIARKLENLKSKMNRPMSDSDSSL